MQLFVLSLTRAGLPAAAVLWAGLILAAPSFGAGGEPVRVRVAAGTYLVGSLVCHQRPERTFHLEGVQLPVCARCTGLYLGAAAGLLTGLGWRRRVQASGARDWRPWIVAAAIPTALTLGLEWVGLWAPSNPVRAIAGAPLGTITGLLLAGVSGFRSKL